VSSTDAGTDIWILRFDGSVKPTPVQITHSKAAEAYVRPSWSPDGTQIAYQRMNSDEVAVYVMDADGKNPRRIAEEAGAPAWSPAGNEVAISDLRPGHRGLAVVDLTDPETREEVTRVDDAVVEEYPAWSPDGLSLVFNSQRSGGSEVWSIARNGQNAAQLTDDPSLDDSPDWSPDGSRIAFLSDRSGEGDIYLVNPEGKNQVQLTNGPYFEGGPIWSPDGRYILFTARQVSIQEEGNLGLWVMRADGTGGTLLFDSAGEDLMADWAP
jgi:Tol biopolymer transport system component